MAVVTIGFNPAVDRVLECPDFHLGGHQQASQVARLAAGKAANVSRALAQLGVDCLATGFVGTNELEYFHEQLMASGPGRILCRYVEVGGKTRENISVIDPVRKIETHLRDKGFAVTPPELQLLKHKIQHEIRSGDYAIFSGSLCDGVTIAEYGELLEHCVRKGARVAVDSSGEALAEAVRRGVWLIKPNLDELRTLIGRDIPNAATAIRDAVKPLLEKLQVVLVSRGPAGAVLVTRGGSFSAHTRKSDPAVRTVGCGDHLLAGFIAEVVAMREPKDGLVTGVGVATARALSTDMAEFSLEVAKLTIERNLVVETL